MNREKQILIAASEARAASAETLTTHGTQHYLDDIIGIDLSYDEIAESAFAKGAEWADTHPAWRMSDDELPYPNEDVLVAFDNGDRGIGYYEGIGDWYVNGIGVVDNIIAWLPLPKFNPKAYKE